MARIYVFYFTRYPDDGLAVIVLGNVRQMDPARIAHLVAEAVEPDLQPRLIDPADEGTAAQLCRVYQQLQAGKPDRSAFTEALAVEIVDTEDSRLVWIPEDGPVRRFLLLETKTRAEETEYNFRAEHDDITFFFSMVLNAGGKVSVFEIHQD